MPVSRPGRLLAPLALVIVVIAIVSIVSGGSSEDASAPSTPAATTTSRTTSTAARRRARRYTVRAGDTLGAIAERTGVDVARLQELNPDVDAGALQTGQRLRLTG